MTLTIERPQRQDVDGLLKADIKWLASQLPHEVSSDYQELDHCEYLLWDSRRYHYQVKLYDDGRVILLKQQYLHDGRLGEEIEVEIVMLPQFVAMITE
ncbi:MAG: hypothetical protein AB4372_16880 [Xenococcus sp. (in: cyanobacteria)]